MSGPPPDLFAGVSAFVTVVEAGSFRAGARRLGVSPPAMSKAIARLEGELGVRLLHRNARTLELTAEGDAFFHRCKHAAHEVRAAREAAAASRQTPRGLLRVSLPARLGRRVMAGLPRLLARHPELAVHAVLTDRFVQLGKENIDVAVRVGAVVDSRDVVAHRLRGSRWITAGSPTYLTRVGTPKLPADLAEHACLRFLMQSGRPQEWSYRVKGQTVSVAAQGKVTSDDGEALVAAAVAGLGLVYAPDFLIRDELESGALVEVLRRYSEVGPPISVLCPPGRARAANVRAFVRFVRDVVQQ